MAQNGLGLSKPNWHLMESFDLEPFELELTHFKQTGGRQWVFGFNNWCWQVKGRVFISKTWTTWFDWQTPKKMAGLHLQNLSHLIQSTNPYKKIGSQIH